MNWTIGIVTDGTQDERLQVVIESIYKAAESVCDNYEIIICGNSKINTETVISFDESIKPGWITKKKNLIVQAAKHENMVLMHDYIVFDANWFKGWEVFGIDIRWDVCMNPIFNKDGTRYRDFCTFPPRPVDYDDWTKTKDMYISGAYMVCKKSFMLKHPLDENLVWGQGEDWDHAKRCRDFWDYKCNKFSTVRLLKQKEPHWH